MCQAEQKLLEHGFALPKYNCLNLGHECQGQLGTQRREIPASEDDALAASEGKIGQEGVRPYHSLLRNQGEAHNVRSERFDELGRNCRPVIPETSVNELDGMTERLNVRSELGDSEILGDDLRRSVRPLVVRANEGDSHGTPYEDPILSTGPYTGDTQRGDRQQKPSTETHDAAELAELEAARQSG